MHRSFRPVNSPLSWGRWDLDAGQSSAFRAAQMFEEISELYPQALA